MFMATEWSQTHGEISCCVNFVLPEWTSPHEHFQGDQLSMVLFICFDRPTLRAAPMWDLAVAAARVEVDRAQTTHVHPSCVYHSSETSCSLCFCTWTGRKIAADFGGTPRVECCENATLMPPATPRSQTASEECR